MASGHVNRTNRPNTWLHRPSLRRDDSSCEGLEIDRVVFDALVALRAR